VAYEDHFWRDLCAMLALPELTELRHAERVDQSASLRSRIHERIATQPLAHWAATLDAHRIPWSPVNSLEDVAADPHFISRGLFEQVRRQDGETEFHVRQPLVFSAFAGAPLKPAPALGEHTATILATLDKTS
jgi:crotonobetainyl-CoA:carnitine CoA-transferase CaiB-like acyl-CoA transferase